MSEKISQPSKSKALQEWGKTQVNAAADRVSSEITNGPDILAAAQAIVGTVAIIAGLAGTGFVGWNTFKPFWVKQGEIAGLWNKWKKTLDIETPGKVFQEGGPYFIFRPVYEPVRVDKTAVVFTIDGQTDDSRQSAAKNLIPETKGVPILTMEGAEYRAVGSISLSVVPNNRTIIELGIDAFRGKNRAQNNVLRDERIAQTIEITGMGALQSASRNFTGLRTEVKPGEPSAFIEDNLSALARTMSTAIKDQLQATLGEEAGQIVVRSAKVACNATRQTREVQRSDLQARTEQNQAVRLHEALGGDALLTARIHTNMTLSNVVDSQGGQKVTLFVDSSLGGNTQGNDRAATIAGATSTLQSEMQELQEAVAFFKEARKTARTVAPDPNETP